MTKRLPDRYFTRPAVGLHWLMAYLIACLFILGLYMHGLRISPLRLRLFNYHKWMGVTVFTLAVARLYWRLLHPPPPLPSSLSAFQKRAALVGHVAMYALMFAIPVSGWLMSSAKGYQTVWFGVMPLPDLVGRDTARGAALQEWHKALAIALALLVIGHIGVALKHHFADRDKLLERMYWFRS
jgi:cytochrome b561